MQLPLAIRLQDDATFENFYQPDASSQQRAVQGLKAFLDGGEQVLFVCGPSGSGVSHLLQASCHAFASESGAPAQYLPLRELQGYGPTDLLEGLEEVPCVCLDQLEEVVGQPLWEHALFHFFNRLRERGGKLIVGANQVPTSLGIELPDLASRLSWGAVFQLESLEDQQRAEALQFRASVLGLELSPEVARFLLQRGPRDMNRVVACLRILDDASLAQQRRLTIPFVKSVLRL